jgi:alkylation response protein AidB-like acyl-CoA dehydrogenase
MTGDEEFAEIFLDDVKVPVANRLGAENEGWRIAQTTLNSERGLTILELSERLIHARWRLLDAIGEAGGQVADDQLRREAVDVFLRIDAVRALVADMMSAAEAGHDIAAMASFVKLQYAQALREFMRLGERATPDSHLRSDFTVGGGFETGNWGFDFMNSYQWSIAGGSNEIQRNIVAERTLGMPREKAVLV